MPTPTRPLTPLEASFAAGYKAVLAYARRDLYAMKQWFDDQLAMQRRQTETDIRRIEAIEMARLAERDQDRDPLH